MWLNSLCNDIKVCTGKELSAIELTAEILDFVRSAPLDLKADFPQVGTIRKWHKNKNLPSNRHSQFLLICFISNKYPKINSTLIDHIQDKLASHIKKPLPKSELDKALAISTYFRSNKSKIKRIREKYIGYYLMIRRCGDDTIKGELFATNLDNDKPNVMNAYWMCDGQLWVGDIQISSTKLTCLLSNTKVDDPFEPVCLGILRAPSLKDKNNKSTGLLLTGSILGWVTGSSERLLNSKIALFKLPFEKTPSSGEDFKSFFDNANPLKLWADNIANDNNKLTKIEKHFAEKHFSVSQSSARKLTAVFQDI